MTEPAVLFSYVVTYGVIIGYVVRLIVRDRRLRRRTGGG